ERATRELQERVMSVRMLPLGSIFSRYPRMVRDLAAHHEKRVDVVVRGAETELDKSVVERLGDPLTHLVRNAVDHGLETPAERRAAGKPERGRLAFDAFHEGGSVVIEVSDDGRGLDLARIREKAVERGLVPAGESVSDERAHELIFLPGFSTAREVSDVSGRGVGLDVVRRNVEALSGSVQLSSEPGRGTRFRLKLPLTLAVLDGLSVRVGEETYILPLSSIVESFEPRREDRRPVLGRGEVLHVRGETMPLVRLGRLFGVPAGAEDAGRMVVIVEHDGRKLGLGVDELLGQAQVVIKSMEQHFRRVPGVIGATITGEGRIALILDVAGISRLAGAA
ncbi:MAG TPA: chemotaxis protein CheA, partial [Planctomycetota bacterium]|nr:chemotaxis protein CheA [Planctomycetota bacterium]